MTDMNKIADKIQKLLNLAGNNPNEEEAQAALLKAQKLMAQYNVDLESLGDGKKELKCSLELTKVKANPRDNQVHIIIANAFACKPIISCDRHLMFFGREDNAKAAKSCMEFIHKTMERGMNHVCREYGLKSTAVRGASAIYNGYAKGFIEGLRDTVGAQTVALAVVVPEDVKEAFSKKFPSLKSYKGKGVTWDPSYMNAYHQGKQDGRSAMNKRSLQEGT